MSTNLPLHGGEPFLKRKGVGDVCEDDASGGRSRFPRAGTPCEHRSLECAYAGLNEVNVRRAPFPSAPFSPLFVLRIDSPGAVCGNEPVMSFDDLRRAGEPGADDIKKMMSERLETRGVDGFLPDVLEDRVIRGERLAAKRKDDRQEK